MSASAEPRGNGSEPPNDSGMLDWGTSKPADDVREIFAALGKPNGSGKSPLDFMRSRKASPIKDDPDYLRQMVVYCRQAGAERSTHVFCIAQLFTRPGQFGRACGIDYTQAINTIERLFKDTEPPDAQKPKSAGKEKGGSGKTQDAIALAFTERHRNQLRFCHHTGKWFLWNSTIWQRQETQLAFHYARTLCRDVGGKKLTRAADAAAVERFARADPALAVTREKWDRDKYLLGTPSGTVNLKTGELRAAQQDDFITRSTSVTPSDQVECTKWIEFIGNVTCGSEDLANYLQRYFGYCLTGDTGEHSLLFCYGKGGNGKGALLKTLVGIMGSYAKVASMDAFTASRNDKHPTDLAGLQGARLVIASETEEGRAWDEQRVKAITGGDPISVRFMRQDFFTFTPEFKPVMYGNHKPSLRNVDDAMKRRLQLVPFNWRPPQVILNFDEVLIPEWPGILHWMIAGCLAWQRDGLNPPPIVRAATDKYFADQDLIARWVDERCETGLEIGDTVARLFANWKGWALRNGVDPGTSGRFNDALERTVPGVRYTRTSRSRGFKGIRLRPPPDQQQDIDWTAAQDEGP
jgi:putative DNA primase/helicase